MKIVSSGRVLNSKGFYEKKLKRRRTQIILHVILFFTSLFALIYFSRQEQFLITEVKVLGENVIDKDEIVPRVESLLTGYYLRIIPRANTFVYPRHTIEQQLVEEFPRFKSVDLNLDGFIDIIEAQKVLGRILIPLDADISSQNSGRNFYPLADLSGSYHYERVTSFKRFFNDLKSEDKNP